MWALKEISWGYDDHRHNIWDEACDRPLERHQKRGLRTVAAKGTVFGAMAAATNGEHGSRRSARGQSFIFVSGTTATEQHCFWRVSLIGSTYSLTPTQEAFTHRVKSRHMVNLGTAVIDLCLTCLVRNKLTHSY